MNSVVTLISDYGYGSQYTAALKGKIATVLPTATVLDLCHHIEPFDVTGAAFFLKQVYANFPDGTWHFICVDTSFSLHKQLLVVECSNQFFVGADNGIFSLLFDELPTQVFRIQESMYQQDDLFPEKNVFPLVLQRYLDQKSFDGFAVAGSIKGIKKSLHPTIEENGINGTVLLIDGYQNAITNIRKEVFEKVRSGRNFTVFYKRKQTIKKISTHYHENGEGDELLLFNENGYLEIAMYRGKSSQLLGLRQGAGIVIEFEN